ncbi:MAG: hypothetical protein K2M46_06325 [Lachnospiraceae bacterium]|nr:hypothetical protein [Lachnospiraceae bacterium]
MKRKILEFIQELVCYLIVSVILLFIAKKFGWIDTSILDNSIGLAIGWLIWKVIMIIIDKIKK